MGFIGGIIIIYRYLSTILILQFVFRLNDLNITCIFHLILNDICIEIYWLSIKAPRSKKQKIKIKITNRIDHNLLDLHSGVCTFSFDSECHLLFIYKTVRMYFVVVIYRMIFSNILSIFTFFIHGKIVM